MTLRRWEGLGDRAKRFAPRVARWGLRQTALRVLGCARKHPDADLLQNALHSIQWIYGRRDPPSEVVAAMKDLAFSGLGSRDPKLRIAAIEDLDEIPDHESEKMRILFRLLLDPVEDVRPAAGWAVAALGPSAIPRLVRALRDSRYDKVGSTFNILMALDWLLQDLPPARVRRLARQIGESLPNIRDGISRWKAAESLGMHIGGETGARVLARLIVSHPREIASLCAQAMLCVQPEIARKHLRRLSDHPQAWVRNLVGRTLRRLPERSSE